MRKEYILDVKMVNVAVTRYSQRKAAAESVHLTQHLRLIRLNAVMRRVDLKEDTRRPVLVWTAPSSREQGKEETHAGLTNVTCLPLSRW